MNPIRYFTIDYTGCKDRPEMHAVLRDSLELPKFLGHSLDALWDGLTGMMYTPAHITFLGVNSLRKVLREEAEKVIGVCVEAQLAYGKITVSVPKPDEER